MTDKYRPETWDGVVGQPTDEIREMLNGRDTPNFLFYGPPGTGKTTTAQLIARELQGNADELMRFNASDDRGIDTIRDRIIPVMDATTLSGAPMVIFLDEMESMTTEAQHALRKPMEDGSAVFLLVCNDVSRVIGPLRSRCYKQGIEFGPVSKSAIEERITQLARRDGVDLAPDDLKSIADHADGDMRGAIQRYEQLARGVTTDPSIAVAAENFTD